MTKILRQLSEPGVFVPLGILAALVLFALNALDQFAGDDPNSVSARIAGSIRSAIVKTFAFAVALVSVARIAFAVSNPVALGVVAFASFTLSGGWNDVAGALRRGGSSVTLPGIGSKSASGYNDNPDGVQYGGSVEVGF